VEGLLATVHGRYIWRIRKVRHTYSLNKSRLNRHCSRADKKQRLSLHGE